MAEMSPVEDWIDLLPEIPNVKRHQDKGIEVTLSNQELNKWISRFIGKTITPASDINQVAHLMVALAKRGLTIQSAIYFDHKEKWPFRFVGMQDVGGNALGSLAFPLGQRSEARAICEIFYLCYHIDKIRLEREAVVKVDPQPVIKP